jgi:uncharacterized protein (TIRG00374 family)
MENKKWIWLVVRVSISLLLLGLLFWKTDISNFSKILQEIDPPLFLLSLLSFVLIHILLSYRWQLLLRVIGLNIPLKSLFKTYLIGLFFNNFLPTAIGGDVARGYDLYRYTQKGKEAAISVIVERLTGFTAQMLIAVIALGLIYPSLHDPLLAWLILGATLVYLLALLVLLNPAIFILSDRTLQKMKFRQLGQKLLQIPEAISPYKSSPLVLTQTVLLSLFLQALTILIYYVLSNSLHLTIPLAYFFLFLPIINIVSMIPISLGGLGLREGISVYLFQIIGVESAHALGLSLAWFLIILLTSLIGGVIFALRNVDRPTPTV